MPKYVDVDALRIDERVPREFSNPEIALGWNMAAAIIEATPAADVAPVRYGRWVKMTGMMPPEFHGHFACSECGWHSKHFIKETEFDFCPGCGARMGKEEQIIAK